MAPRVFLITGCSTGFGEELVKVVLQKGDYVVATARNSSKLSFDGANDTNSLLVDLDVTKKDSIDKAFDAAVKKFKRVDVVVNNAGYGLNGPFETLSDKQIRKQMDINFFGLVDVTRKAIETMRELKTGGVIQQITSIGGQIGFPNLAVYCASKFAVEGFTEGISKEMKPEWGIKFTIIEPGGFRTDWSGRSMEFGEIPNSAYAHVDPKKSAQARHGNQAGDPQKAAKVFYDLAVMENPPIRCVVGTDAYSMLTKHLETHIESVKTFEKLSNSTDVDGYQAPS
ncbi:DltE Short-chain dehydrogenase of various substrate specificities [Pyrenophora tritici-repentis]|uniref:Short chain dehydrogenase n=1 Tax=Pyrenophora tritici-repentis TaxID=45151 RepID=A0A2W1EWU8_9PLEO|nr:Short-chain alcohol dehydrogenase [Pyrenophora tritici-repentis]KAI0574547.1 Short-chain alcohol dehydrogenase [Pyrenophora tritici-repentis]KAI0586806.1 Short-chain alcohol dehydrogenase [Pyrenophora tritici-repentis]KAI0609449.1 Short-chain alcohol dehydrogenase [Pyrenophora tritici-repentis]KAI1510367.1 short chain dehydrogenase [Pyrenophora tritici-repentis]